MRHETDGGRRRRRRGTPRHRQCLRHMEAGLRIHQRSRQAGAAAVDGAEGQAPEWLIRDELALFLSSCALPLLPRRGNGAAVHGARLHRDGIGRRGQGVYINTDGRLGKKGAKVEFITVRGFFQLVLSDWCGRACFHAHLFQCVRTTCTCSCSHYGQSGETRRLCQFLFTGNYVWGKGSTDFYVLIYCYNTNG